MTPRPSLRSRPRRASRALRITVTPDASPMDLHGWAECYVRLVRELLPAEVMDRAS